MIKFQPAYLDDPLVTIGNFKCPKLAPKIESETISPPSRPWINGILQEIDAHIISRRLIDFKRLESCSMEVVDNFFSSYIWL